MHVQLCGQFLRDVMTTRTHGTFVCFLQSQNVHWRQKLSRSESAGRIGNELRDMLWPPADIHQAEFSTQTAC